MTVVQAVQQMIDAWKIDLVGSWSIWDLVQLCMLVVGVGMILAHFWDKADTK